MRFLALRGRVPERRAGACVESRTVPFEQIGQSASKRLWRQNCEIS
jgi:hypothetical protein